MPGRRRLRSRSLLLAVCAYMAMAACQPRVPIDVRQTVEAGPGLPTVTIHVASNGWHSAIVLAQTDIPPAALPEVADFPEASWLAFGWGDADYFPQRDPSILTALSAALLPTPSVIQVSGLRQPPGATYPKDEVVTLKIRAEGLKQLIAYLHATFDRNGTPRARSNAPGLDRDSRFYRATGSFHLFNTCNSWTARGLRSAGLPVDTANAIDAESLLVQLRGLSPPAGDR